MAKAYHDAYIMKRRMQNENMWIQGLYNYHALSAVIATAFGKHRESYDIKPLDIFPKSKLEIEEEKRAEREKLIKFLNAWKRASDDKQKQ